MKDDVRAALEIPAGASARDRTIDLTTYGAATGKPRRIEMWFHHVDGRWFLSGSPGRRDWYANVRGDPRLIVHLKRRVRADLPARGVPIVDQAERRRLFALILAGLREMSRDASAYARDLDAWTAGSPLVEILFDEHPEG